MNKRIELVSDTVVKVQRLSGCVTVLSSNGGEHLSEQPFTQVVNAKLDGDCMANWDAEGLEAIGLCIACFRQTGSFAALSDESNVPFVGKRIVFDEYGGPHIGTVAVMDGPTACWIEYKGTMHNRPNADLKAIAPAKPKVHPWTKLEAVHHIGRTFRYECKDYLLTGVFESCVEAEQIGSRSTHAIPYTLLVTATLGEREFCGVPEPN